MRRDELESFFIRADPFYEADSWECPKCKGPMRIIARESRIRESSGEFSITWGCGRRR